MKALVIYLISKPHEIDPKKSSKGFFVASLGNSIIKRADTLPNLKGRYAAFCGNKKNVPTNRRDAKFMKRPIVVSGLVTGNCQLLFNYFHNNYPFCKVV